MVIKKPYAFLIKNFRLIHGLLFGLLLFLAIRSYNIYNFFNSYVTNHTYYIQNDLAGSYVTITMFLAAIVAIAILLVIYFILALKNKTNKLYLYSILYYSLLFIYFIYMYSVFKGLETKSMDVETVRAYRDICLLVVFPQIIFLIIIFGRALGFNLKQFEFRKDLEEMDVDLSDSEEVEVTLGLDTYKAARFARKFLRLTKYFILENKLFVITMSSIVIFSLSFYTFTKLNKYQESYAEAQDLDVSQLKFNVKASYITNVDISNNIISEGKQYILVVLDVKNKLKTTYSLRRESFGLIVNKELIIPNFGLSEQFKDVGDVFTPTNLAGGEEKQFVVVFEINSEDIQKDYLFKIKNNDSGNSLVDDFYKEVIITPTDLNENNEAGNYKLPANIDFKDSMLGKSTLSIEEYEIADKFKEEHKYTVDGKEVNGVYSIIPSSTNRESLGVLKIKGNLKLDSSVYYSKYITKPADFFEQYAIIRYRYMGEYKTTKVKKINVTFETDNYSYLEVPKNLQYANKIEFIILIRGIKYTINLK